MHTTYSLHKINDTQTLGFSPADYSRFKFGCTKTAAAFGKALAQGFIEKHLSQQPIEKQIVVISSPYSFIPTATFPMKTQFVFSLNRWLSAHQLPVVEETKVHRTVTYKEDYGALNAEERMRLIGKDKFHIDKSFLTDKVLLFLDDIRITGSHERVILKMAADFGLQNELYMLYFAELTNPNICPTFENYLNYYAVKSIFDTQDIIHSPDFFMNTRLVKFLLSAPIDDFKVFIQQQTGDFLHLLYDMAIGNGYHSIEAYKKNLIALQIEFQALTPTLSFS